MKSELNWTDLGWPGCNWTPLDAQMPCSTHLLSFGMIVCRGPWSQYHRCLQCAQCHDWFTHLFGVVLSGKMVF